MKNFIRNIKGKYTTIIVLALGVFIGWLLFHSSGSKDVNQNQTEEHTGHDAEEHTIWTCSMHPQIRQDKPGLCPICAMDLIPLSSMESEGDAETDPNEITMTDAAAGLADVETITVKRGMAMKSVMLQGKVYPDERNIAEITARYGGRIEKLFVNFTGQSVRKGEKLATIYSPELISAQRELIEAVALKDSRPALYKSARTKLKLWDLSEEQINGIEAEGEPQLYFNVLSPIQGTVMERHIAVGDYIKEGSGLFQVTDLSKIWLLFDAYESDLPWISRGDKMEVSIPSVPGRTFTGNVSFIDPFIDGKTRAAKVRVELANKQMELKPEMFVNGILQSQIATSGSSLLIPKSSVLWTGKRSVVYIKVPDRETPSFLYREITLGPTAGNFYVVESGLNEGEEIAVNGVFKIDAAAQLAGKQSMMSPDGGGGSAGSMPGMDMGSESGGNQPAKKSKADEKVAGNQETKVPESFKKQLSAAVGQYLKMKDAFVASNADAASREASKLDQSLRNVDMKLLKGDAHKKWMDALSSLKASVSAIAASKDIEEQRTNFSTFNLTFYRVIKDIGLKDLTVYYQYCPMAFDNKGGYWLSGKKEIENPYFGDAMLKCGETKETLK